MYKKYFFIGLGGSGGKTLRFLKRDLRRWLDENGAADHDMPKAWQFLHIDTPTAVDGTGIGADVPMLESDEYLGLVSSGVNFGQVQNMLDSDSSMHDETQTWRVEPAGIGVPIGLGAGQFRAIGKTIATAYLPMIKSRIELSVSRINNAANVAELSNLYRTVTKDTPKNDSDPIFVVISSLAGGTGAGLLFPVTDIIRSLDPVAGGDSIGLLYTPEVFSSLGAAMTGGVQANSLAALAELMNGCWWGGGQQIGGPNRVIVEPKTSASLRRAGLPFSIDQSGPAFNFVIGRTGVGGVTFGRPEELFEMVGRTLVSWVADPVVSDNLVAYVIANWRNASTRHQQQDVLVYEPGAPGLPHEIGYPNLSGLGFSRVGIGSEYFRKYARQRIARDSIEIAVRSHISNPEAARISKTLNTINPEEISNEWARQLHHEFLLQCKLSELGPEENQIQESFTPTNLTNLQEEFVSTAREKAESFAPKKARGNDWVTAIEDGIQQALESYRSAARVSFNKRIESWIVGDGPERVLRAVESHITRCGLLTTAALVRLTWNQLKNEVSAELQNHDLVNYQRWADSWKNEVRTTLSGQNSVLQAGDSAIEKALQDGVLFAKYHAHADMVAVVPEIIEDFCDGFLKPLADSLQAAFDVASKAHQESQSWPEWNEAKPPASSLPPSSEFTIIDPDDFGSLFVTLLEQSYSDENQNRSREITRNDVLSGNFVRVEVERNNKKRRELEHLFAINVSKEWWPRASLVADGTKSKSNAYFDIRMSADEVLQRADAWLLKPNSPFAEVIDADLLSFLGRKDAFGAMTISESEKTRRRNRFLSQFKEAFNAAQPLVNIDKGLFGLVHNNTPIDQITHKVISQIPLANHDLQEELEVMLRSLGVDDNIASKLFVAPNGDEKKKYVDISTVLWPPMSVIPIESLVKPIAAEWSRSVQNGGQSEFWMFRRSTRLSDFIPAPQALIIAMIRGWYIANLMGLVVRRQLNRDPIVISIGRQGSAEFPSPFLSASAERDDDICLILESLALAYTNCSIYGNLNPLKPYRELRDLGKSQYGHFFEYEGPGERFMEFLRTGDSPFKITDPLVVGESLKERAQSAANMLTVHRLELTKKYDEAMEVRRLQASKLSTPPLFTGLWTPISKVLNDLITAIESLVQTGEKRQGL